MVFRARTRLGSRAPTLGLFVDWLEDGYQSAVACGVLAGAQAAGATMICFTGGAPGAHERSAKQRNHVFELATADTVDALVVMSGSLANHIGLEGVTRFIDRYATLPRCSIALDVAGVPSVVVDNESGMRSVVEHFIRVHGHKRIAFVRGPVANAEAERRFETYRAVLAENSIAFDPALTAIGTFELDSGRVAVRTWLDEQGLSIDAIDAIVAANDSMAFGVLEELAARGIRVPAQVGVAGFDDVEDARYAEPPLTTVRQPLDEQGREAVRLVMAALQRRGAPPQSVLRTELVVRESCGCFGAARVRRAAAAASPYGFEASLIGRRQAVLSALSRASRGSLAAAGSDWEGRILNALASDLRGETNGAFLRYCEEMVERLARRGVDLKPCHEVLSTLREEILLCLGKEPERRELAEDLFQQARLAIGSVTERVLGRGRLKLERWARTLTKVGASLIGTFELSELAEAIESRFPELGIRSCFVVRYQGDAAPSQTSRLLLAYDSVAPLPALKGDAFTTAALLPSELLGDTPHLRNFVLAPLFFKNEVLGYAMVEFDAAQMFAYEALRDLLSAALKGAALVEQLRSAERARDEARLSIVELEARLQSR
ncbi:MAG: LacI family DNA-binding transcriptional regulator [Myxococcota bacterium]